MPAIADASTTVDGTAYSATDGVTVRNDNRSALGAGGTAGVDGLPLQTLDPELELAGNGAVLLGLDLQASSATVRNVAVYGFGTKVNVDTDANVRIGAVAGALIERCVVGTTAGSFSNPGSTAKGDNIRVVGGGGTIRNNLVGYSAGRGIALKGGASGFLVEGNEVRGNAAVTTTLAGVALDTTSGATVRGNLVWENKGAGIDTPASAGSNTIINNTISGNGAGAALTPGIRLYGTGTTVDRNILTANTGAGVMVTSAASGNTITKNAIYGNGPSSGQIGIDLLDSKANQNTGTSPFVTLNDSGDGDAGGNGLLNYPVLVNATVVGSNLELSGFARPGSAIELFIADPDPSGFGEGKTYLTTLVEGSSADLDAGTGTYGPASINNLLQGTDTTNRFRFAIPIPGGVALGTWLTATATVSGSTSEFSGKAAVGPFTLSGTVYEDVNGDGDLSDKVARPGVAVHLFRDGGDGLPTGADDAYLASATTDASGRYTFNSLGQEVYWVLADSRTVSPGAGGALGTVWAEQTYGAAGALCANGSGGTGERAVSGPCFGGRLGGVSDVVFPTPPTTATLAAAEHVIRQNLRASATGVDFGFSFNAVTNASGGDGATVQGSLRQFLQNANAIPGANAMRFVPAVASNASGGGGSWWQIPVTVLLPAVTDASTTIDGKAYSFTDGVTLRDANPGVLGAGGTVGVGGLTLPKVSRPELEIVASGGRAIGLDLQASTAAVRGIAISGFGTGSDNDGHADIRLCSVTGAAIDNNVI